MSFGTSNKFAVLQVQQPQQPRPKGDKLVNSIPGPAPVAKQSNAASEKDKQATVSENRNNNNNRGRGERGRGGNRGGSRGGRGGSRGGSVDRATLDKVRDPNQPPKRNKRIYDRNSNVPKNDSKKGGQGTGNWGNEKEDPQRGADDAKKDLTVEGESAEVKVEEQPVVEQEPEDKTMTLKEYQEQLAALAPKFEAPKRREANEGEKNDLHKYVVLKKEDDEEKLLIKPKKEKAKKQSKKQTIALSDLVNVNAGGQSDDRRGPRKFNNNNYNKKPKKVSIAIEDIDSFPALK